MWNYTISVNLLKECLRFLQKCQSIPRSFNLPRKCQTVLKSVKKYLKSVKMSKKVSNNPQQCKSILKSVNHQKSVKQSLKSIKVFRKVSQSYMIRHAKNWWCVLSKKLCVVQLYLFCEHLSTIIYLNISFDAWIFAKHHWRTCVRVGEKRQHCARTFFATGIVAITKGLSIPLAICQCYTATSIHKKKEQEGQQTPHVETSDSY